ncbi:lysophospholipid acyltransferase family protein [Truepera radiovictrix]|uniref:Phospholipid/glycerol acyltransferase n=1 Tax=Truepera radiovictrix (strain DSM 17093 / CIP 108686 / LMG 22925 / RQ-24) TaxID=649638 RepID=D7CV30_TRURR|nr:lysophospholipid acyltransferase family protein [Truepera radiovictrix]ADI15857.1 phospholipid/glycerol acyltransferase [Truepera radiovictrix DSM 17093]WMT58517.1 lysophospholipid acyltransferase family protein [Truepera radiovictrix]
MILPPDPARVRELWFYLFAAFVVRNGARLFLGLRVEGVEHIPREGGLIIAGNHISSFDPPIIGSLVPREIHFMAKRELFDKQPMRWIAEHLMAFPVDRERNDTKAIKDALRFLRAGLAVGIFPQGTRNAGDAQALDGAAFLAQRAGVPLQPVAIWREGRAFRVRFGRPLPPSGRSKAEMRALTETLMAHINALLPPHLRAQASGETTRSDAPAPSETPANGPTLMEQGA